MNLNINTKTKNLILMIASIVIVASILILPIVVVGQGILSISANGFSFLFDKLWEAPRNEGALAIIGILLAVAGGGAATYFSAVKFNQPNFKQYFMYAAIGAAVGALFMLIQCGQWNGESFGMTNAGFGVWLSLIASAVCIAGCFVKANDEQ